jgi:polyisoprenoid-binding protein YceI
MTNAQQTTFDSSSHVRDIAASGEWTLDGPASRVVFAVKHLWGLVTVRGHFAGLDGTAQVAADGTMTVSLVIDAASVDTKQNKRDEHLRSARFFHAEQHPRIEVRVDDVTLTSRTAAAARGQLTIAERTQPIRFDATITLSADSRKATVEAALDVDRTAFGITFNPLHMSGAAAQVTARLVFRHAANATKG